MSTNSSSRVSLTKFAWLSAAAAVLTIVLKLAAYWMTGSIGIFSDAMESFVNLAGALIALAMLTIAARPPDEEHAFGHGKVEYFASGAEGTMIIIAAASICYAAAKRLIDPQPIEMVGAGLFVTLIATVINFATAIIIRRAGKRYDSITLDANSRHLMTDVWTSLGVIVSVGIVAVSKIHILDPIIALVVAANILREGFLIVKQSLLGLMDTTIPAGELQKVTEILESHKQEHVTYHALRSRQAGSRRFVSVHILVPGEWTVHRGHELLEQIESEMRAVVPNLTTFTHLESLDDPASWEDIGLDRSR